MYTSLAGRYVKHRLKNDLPEELFSRKGRRDDITLSEEKWAKKNQMETTTRNNGEKSEEASADVNSGHEATLTTEAHGSEVC